MKIDAQVKSIEKLKDYFFLVPDYQREYVWKADDQVEQFLRYIDNEYDENAEQQESYFIGSIIIVKNKNKYDVIDGSATADHDYTYLVRNSRFTLKSRTNRTTKEPLKYS